MKPIWWRVARKLGLGTVVLVATALAATGCVTKATAHAQARAAYLAGQQEAITRMQQAQAGGANVHINGQVHIPILPWVQGMSLRKAIVTAEYTGGEPSEIIILRNGLANRVDVKKLLAPEAHDIPLQPGDVVQIVEPQTGPIQPQP